MKLDILMLLRPDFKPEITVYPQADICSYLRHFGHNIAWIMRTEDNKQVQQFSFDDIHVYATPRIKFHSGSSLLITILKYIPNILTRMRTIIKIFKNGKYNLIFASDDVYDGLIAAYISRRYKVPFVFALTNPLEQEWESFKIDPRWSLFSYYLVTRLDLFIGKRLLKKADLILTISSFLERHLVSSGLAELKIMSCPNGIDTNLFSNRDGTTIRSKYYLDDLQVIIYVGTLGKLRSLKMLVQAFTRVKKEKGNVKLMMVGEGSDEEDLRRLATGLGVGDDIIFTGVVSHSEIPDFIAAADIAVSLVPPLSFYKMSSPIKLFEYMAMAKPVVVNEEIPEQKIVVEESEGGILVSYTPVDVADAIINLLDYPDKATEMGRRGREWVVKNRTYEILARKLEQRFTKLML